MVCNLYSWKADPKVTIIILDQLIIFHGHLLRDGKHFDKPRLYGLTLKILITAFAAQKASFTTSFLQRTMTNLLKLRRNIWVKFVEKTLMYPKIRSTLSHFWPPSF